MYAACRSLSERSNALLVLDVQSGYKSDHKYKRSFLLEAYNINCKIKSKNYWPILLSKAMRKIFILLNNKKIYYIQKNVSYDCEFNKYINKNNVTVEGYWQSEKYFLDIADKIRQELTIKEYIFSNNFYKWKNKIQEGKFIAVHFRFYEDSKGNLEKGYYVRACEYLKKNSLEFKFLIFTDNLGEYKSKFSNIYENALVISDEMLSELEEFELMRICKAHIIANSTFSWWAAWLSNSELIIAPNFKKLEGEGTWGFRGLIPDYFVKL
jgi:hypothetical protein